MLGNVEKESLRTHLSGPIQHPKAPAIFCGGLLMLLLYSCSRWYDSLISKYKSSGNLMILSGIKLEQIKKSAFHANIETMDIMLRGED